MHMNMNIHTNMNEYECIFKELVLCKNVLYDKELQIDAKFPQIYTRDPRTCAIFILALGSILGSLGFSCNKNSSGSSGAYVSASVIVKTPKLMPMVDDAITWGGIGSLGTLVHTCENFKV